VQPFSQFSKETPRLGTGALSGSRAARSAGRGRGRACRGGTISITGVYGGTADPINMLQLFDKGVKIAMGQVHVKRWIDDLLPLVSGDGDPLGVEDLCTHRLPLEKAPHGYEIFQKKGGRRHQGRAAALTELLPPRAGDGFVVTTTRGVIIGQYTRQ
jgi:hypothetical protein